VSPTPAVRALFEIAERKGITQNELAHQLGTSQALVSSWKVGRHQPKAPVLDWLASAVGAEIVVREKE
jgi:transcriptional regulator with XRE-family HTH domain